MGKLSKGALALLLAALATTNNAAAQTAQSTVATTVPYGANAAASGRFTHDGVSLYYGTYGQGEPLLMIHGNGGSIGWLAAQIDYFKAHRRVIIMDSRDHGRSSDSKGALTYEKMTDDQAALLDHLGIAKADVLGWSDGGIEALLLGIRHPEKVGKLVAMAANLQPDAVYPETDKLVRDMLASIPADVRATPQGKRDVKVTTIMLTEPHIDMAALKKVTAPTLILSGDHDLIRLDHTLAIYEALPNAELAVFPNSTHFVPYDDPQMFNATVERFLNTSFKNTDRIADTMKSYERLASDLPK